MGSTIGSHKTLMPPGEPPCCGDAHRHVQVPESPPVPIVPDLQARVTAANKYVEDEFQALIATRYKMKEMVRRAREDWDYYSKPLMQSCNATRDTLVNMGEETGECENAQEVELPKLFVKRSQGPSVWSGSIGGCAKFQEHHDLVEAGDCKCANGIEKDGCKFAQAQDDGSEMNADHSLLCTHLRKRVLPNLKLWRLTSPGGACYMDNETPYNKPMLPTGVPKDFEMPRSGPEESSMPPILLSLEAPFRLAAAKRINARRSLADKVRAFL